jgi:hypothetical protein
MQHVAAPVSAQMLLRSLELQQLMSTVLLKEVFSQVARLFPFLLFAFSLKHRLVTVILIKILVLSQNCYSPGFAALWVFNGSFLMNAPFLCDHTAIWPPLPIVVHKLVLNFKT